jgi:ureidoacrylate peracid hydrolase
LDLQLKKHGIHQLIVIGLIAHTCIEATVRYAADFDKILHCTATTRRTPRHSRCLCSVSLESSSAIIVFPIVHALQSKQNDQGDLFL